MGVLPDNFWGNLAETFDGRVDCWHSTSATAIVPVNLYDSSPECYSVSKWLSLTASLVIFDWAQTLCDDNYDTNYFSLNNHSAG